MPENKEKSVSQSGNSDNAVTLEDLFEYMKNMQESIETLRSDMQTLRSDMQESNEVLREELTRDIRKLSRKLDNQELEIENIRYSGVSANHVGFREAINATAAIGAPSRRLNSAYYR